MSTKIYNAYRVVDPSKVFDLMWEIRERSRALARHAIQDHYWDLVCDMSLVDAPEPSLGKRLSAARETVRSRYREQLGKAYVNEYNLDVSVAIYPYSGGICLRSWADPVSIVRRSLDFLHDHPGLVDFHYQNQSDSLPEQCTAQQWRERRDAWEEIYRDHTPGNHLSVDIVSHSGFHLVDPYLLFRDATLATRDTVPSPEEAWCNRFGEIAAVRQVNWRDGEVLLNVGEHSIQRSGDSWQVRTEAVIVGTFGSLNKAAEWLLFELQPESIKDWVRRRVAQDLNDDPKAM